jgi:hypothetical protein
VAQQFEMWIFQKLKYVVASSGEKIVNAQDITTIVKQTFAEMRPQEPSATGDQNSLFY